MVTNGGSVDTSAVANGSSEFIHVWEDKGSKKLILECQKRYQGPITVDGGLFEGEISHNIDFLHTCGSLLRLNFLKGLVTAAKKKEQTAQALRHDTEDRHTGKVEEHQ